MKKKARIKVGVIGCGQIGLRHIQSYAKMPDVDIVAVADINKAARDRGSELAGGAPAQRDFRKLLDMKSIEAVDVCLHNNLHAPITIEAFKAGKHVYCEKPIAGTYADGLAMVRAAARHKKRLAIQVNSLFDEQAKTAKRIIDAGLLGRPYFAQSIGFRRRGRCYVDGYGSASFVQKRIAAGGALIDLGIYHLGRILYLLGNPAAKTISGSTFQKIDMYAKRKKESRFNVEELGTGYVRLDGGITFVLLESWAVHLGSLGRSCIAGHLGGLTFDPLTLHRTEADIETDATLQSEAADRRWRSTDAEYSGYDSSHRHWIAELRGDVPEPVDSAAVALNAMLISEGVYLSQKLGREVTAAEVKKASASTALQS